MRRRKRATPDTTVPSPCIGICRLDEAQLCVGCLRHQDEIRDWMVMNREEKLAVLAEVEQRRKSA